MKIILPILEKILLLSVILLLILSACVSSYYIGKQSHLDMREHDPEPCGQCGDTVSSETWNI